MGRRCGKSRGEGGGEGVVGVPDKVVVCNGKVSGRRESVRG